MIVCCGQYTVPTCVGCPNLRQQFWTAPNTGWICPKCQVANAPTVQQCPRSMRITCTIKDGGAGLTGPSTDIQEGPHGRG